MTRKDACFFLQIIRVYDEVLGFLGPLRHIAFMLLENPGCHLVKSHDEWYLYRDKKLLASSVTGKQHFRRGKTS